MPLDPELRDYLQAMEHRSNERIGSLETRLNERIETLEKRLNEGVESLETRLNERIEIVETRLLTEFHKWASPMDARVRSHTAALRALDLEVEALGDRVKHVEDGGKGESRVHG